MTQNRFYSSVAAKTTLTGTINASATTLTVASATGFPASLPYTLILERDTANEEVVTVTAVSSLTLTVTRAQDGTTGVSHATGAVVEHGVSARDFNEPQVHIAASSAVHGITGSVVGTTDTQTLTNKTLDAASTIGGVSGTTLAADHAAWSVWSAFLTGLTGGAGVFRYKQVGKTVFILGHFTAGTINVAALGGVVQVSLPVSPHDTSTVAGDFFATPVSADGWIVTTLGLQSRVNRANGSDFTGAIFCGSYEAA